MHRFLEPLTTSYRQSARRAERLPNCVTRKLCSARRDDMISVGGGSDARQRSAPTTPVPAAKAGDDGGDDPEPDRPRPHFFTERLLRLPQVLDLVGLGKTTIYEMVQTGEFPRPRKVRHLSLWPESEVRKWIDTVVRSTEPV